MFDIKWSVDFLNADTSIGPVCGILLCRWIFVWFYFPIHIISSFFRLEIEWSNDRSVSFDINYFQYNEKPSYRIGNLNFSLRPFSTFENRLRPNPSSKTDRIHHNETRHVSVNDDQQQHKNNNDHNSQATAFRWDLISREISERNRDEWKLAPFKFKVHHGGSSDSRSQLCHFFFWILLFRFAFLNEMRPWFVSELHNRRNSTFTCTGVGFVSKVLSFAVPFFSSIYFYRFGFLSMRFTCILW